MTSPSLPAVPACWTWAIPTLPLEPHLGAVRGWQAGRCAVCGVVPPQRAERFRSTAPRYVCGLYEDHDHASDDRRTRGLLCPGCNVREGRKDAPAVFEMYRERYPTLILNVPLVYGRGISPALQRIRVEVERREDAKREAARKRRELAERILHDRRRTALEAVRSGRASVARDAHGVEWPEYIYDWVRHYLLSGDKASRALADSSLYLREDRPYSENPWADAVVGALAELDEADHKGEQHPVLAHLAALEEQERRRWDELTVSVAPLRAIEQLRRSAALIPDGLPGLEPLLDQVQALFDDAASAELAEDEDAA